VILDAPTGQILVMLGSRDYYRKDIQGENNNLLALNSPGSSFKPFVYLAGIVNLNWTPATMLDDKPTQYVESDGTVFVPHDPVKNQYLGRVTVRQALGNSLNIPAFNAAKAITIPAIVDIAHKLGFSTFNGQYGPSIAIGGTDIRVLDLAYAYSTLARGGEMVGDPTLLPDDAGRREMEPVSILSVKAADGTVLYDGNQRLLRTQVVSPEQAYLVTSILTDGQAECITFGCGGLQFKDMTVAVKTGTSEPYDPEGPDAGKIGETLAFGYTPDYVVGVWAGNADNEPVQNIYSTTIAYQIMHDAMLQTYDGRPATAFTEPPGVTSVRICDRDGCRQDLALKSQVDQLVRAANSSKPQTIVIDIRTGKPADASTPPQFRRPVPADDQQTTKTNDEKQNNQAGAGGNSNGQNGDRNNSVRGGNSALGSLRSDGGPIAVITSPSGSVAVGSLIQIRGTATAGAAFDHYILQYSSASAPANWITVGTWSLPVTNGVLGAWVLTGAPPGQYSIRLIVADKAGQTASSVVQVAVE
jgi:membrane peptidoglycan carboxypeptidase